MNPSPWSALSAADRARLLKCVHQDLQRAGYTEVREGGPAWNNALRRVVAHLLAADIAVADLEFPETV